ncbi:membrane protein insertase YidC [Pelagovum sp. HNIBRBA483]|uniref:membrane protein insertase YidC n=1 Tax=Pelagovum sp. HNIBRBA483 TaxID=3233341 RepID=UPI0034A29449
MDDQNKNFLKATVLSFMVILTWLILFPPEPPADPETTTEVASDATQSVETPDVGVTSTTTAPAQPTEDATVEAARIAIETPELSGSLSLQGGRLDDVYLTEYRETIDEDAETVRLMRPQGENDAYLAVFGWAGNGVNVPDPDTLWSIESGDKLTPETPVVLVWDNGQGLTFRKEINVDDQFMFSITQSVSNASGEEVVLRPYGLIRRHTLPDNLKRFFILHEGLVRMSDGTLEETSYKDIEDYGVSADDGTQAERIEVAESGWIGYTDHYWMTTLIPEQGTPFRSVSKYFASREIYQSEAVMPVETIANGSDVQVTTRLFVGPKEWEAIRTYQDEQGVDRFVDSIDWGWFFFLTKPIFSLLHWLNGVVGNMGWSIIALTLIIKAIVLPLAYKSYVSMAKMKELQPEMEKLKERAGDDRQALQQGMMKLYKENKVNPASGCLPILIQIPIFFSLYKVIFVTIELRHAEWIGWIRDLSAPDPSSILNLFGLLPYGTPEPGSLFAIVSLGVLPILLGISMWLQQKLNPAPTDPTQKMVFAWMPWIFMFMLGSFASGLVLYWIANNTITFLQQYAIMRSHGHKPDVFGNITSSFKRKKAEADTKTSSAKGTKK